MSFVKLDCAMLTSSIWIDRDVRDMFITALLMATPGVLDEPQEGIQIRSLEPLGWTVPAGWYGMVSAASTGIISSCGVDRETGLRALEALAAPDPESRTPDHDGRRMVRIDGGFVILNFFKHRDKDHTAPDRMRRYRDRKKSNPKPNPLHAEVATVTCNDHAVTRHVTQAEAEAEDILRDQAAPRPATPPVGSLFGDPPAIVDPLSKVKIARVKHRLPSTWNPTQDHRDLARQAGIDADREAAKFRDHFAANGKPQLDWDAAFRNWIRRSAEMRAQNHPNQPPRRVSEKL